LVQNPPPGSKMEAAKVYGVDLTLNLRSLTRTPAERIREMEAALKFAEELRRAAAHLDRGSILRLLSRRSRSAALASS
jgi:hypothetical protein